jgi:beta-lactamase regulating signal transducer with metallopeptidase domain
MTPDLAWWGRLAAFLAAQTMLIAGAATLVSFKLRAPQARRAVWRAALFAMTSVWVGEPAGLGEKARALWPRETAGIVQAAGQFTTAPASPPAAAQSQPPVPVHREEPARPVTWPAEVWLLGSLLLLLRASANRAWLGWQRRRMAPADAQTQEAVARLCVAFGLRGVETRIWARLRGPVAFGWRHPTVALPPGFFQRFTPVQREAMLAHELAHLAARDPLWLALADTVCALAWWNPAVWRAAMQLRAASEAAADEASALVPSGPAALAESLLRFGRDLAETGAARGLGVAGNGFRSGLGRRVHALLTHSGKWRELPAVWRWSPAILALGVVLALTLLPVLSRPSGSVFGLLVHSGKAHSGRPSSQPVRAYAYNTDPIDDSNSPPMLSRSGATNDPAASKTVVLDVKMAGVLEGSLGQAALDKLIGYLLPDEPGGPDVVAQFLREANISHVNYIRVDYLIGKNAAAVLRPGQFKTILDSIEQQAGNNLMSFPQAAAPSGHLAHVGVEDVLDAVTGVEFTINPAAMVYQTDKLSTGTTAEILPTASADGWNLSVLSRNTGFRGYDKPAKGQELKVQASNGVPMTAVMPLPHLYVYEMTGKGTVREGETLALRGPEMIFTNTFTNTVLGIFHHKRTETIRTRLYLFVTANSETK